MRNLASLLLALLLLSGCELMNVKFPGSEPGEEAASGQGSGIQAREETAIIQTPVIIAPTTDEDEILQIMRYSRIMQSYPRAKLKEEFKRVATELAEQPSTADQLRMAVLLSIPDTTFKNEKRAMLLLSKIVNDVNQSSALQEYAYLLLETLQQRSEVMQINRELSEELHAERQKRAQLQQQLDALKSIEKSISQRQLQNEAETEKP